MELRSKITDQDLDQYTTKIGVIGLGGAGTNTVELLQKRLGDSVRFLICNTDVQSVRASTCKNKILLGPKLTQGQGAGGKAAVGKAATEESIGEIVECIQDLDMIVIVAGAGGGTGSGAVQVVGQAAKERDILTIAIITSPFDFEGTARDSVAEKCIRELEDSVDTLVVNRNQKLLEMTKGKASLAEAFQISDQFSADCVESFVNIIKETNLLNVDFADLASIARNRRSKAIMGTGYAEGENAGIRAIEDAMSSFLLECEQSWSDVDNLLLCINGGSDLSMEDVSEIGNKVKSSVYKDSNIIMGAHVSKETKNAVRIFIFGTTRRRANQSSLNAHKNDKINQKSQKDVTYDNVEFSGQKHDLHEPREEFNKEEKPQKKGFSLFGWNIRSDKKKTTDLPDFLKNN